MVMFSELHRNAWRRYFEYEAGMIHGRQDSLPMPPIPVRKRWVLQEESN